MFLEFTPWNYSTSFDCSPETFRRYEIAYYPYLIVKLIRFVTDCLRKFVRFLNYMYIVGTVLPRILWMFANPIYFCRQSVINLIGNTCSILINPSSQKVRYYMITMYFDSEPYIVGICS